MRRLVKAKVSNSRELMFERPEGLQAVFDGHVELTDFEIVGEDVKLKKAAVFDVVFMVAH